MYGGGYKNCKISCLTQKLYKGIMSLSEFFEAITNKENDIVNNDIIEDAEAKIFLNQRLKRMQSPNQPTEVLKYVICVQEPRNILRQPCKHFKICSYCPKQTVHL